MIQRQPAEIHQFQLGKELNFVYLIVDPATKKAAWIDPNRDLGPIPEFLTLHGLELESILLTHSHADHVSGLAEVQALYPAARLAVHSDEWHRLTAKFSGKFSANDPVQPFFDLKSTSEVHIGSLRVQVIHTPGHTAGAVCFYLKQPPHSFLITGDTLFLGDCGRTDLPTGNTPKLFQSLQVLRTLPEDTLVYPGHHYSPPKTTTLGEQLRSNPAFQAQSPDDLERWLTS